MTNKEAKPEGAANTAQMTAADAAKRVKRTVTEVAETKSADGKPSKKVVTKEVAVEEGEVLAFRDHGTHVVVVTRDGQKLAGLAK